MSKDVLRLDYSTLFLLHENGSDLVMCATEGFPEKMVDTFVLSKRGLPSYVMQTGRVEVVDDFRMEERFEVTSLMASMDIRSAIAVPMMVANRILGVLIGHSEQLRKFTEEEKVLYQVLGNHAAIAIDNLMHIESLYQSERKRDQKIRELEVEREISREKTDEFESIFSNLMTGVMLLRGGRYLARCNRKLAEMFGYGSVEELIGVSSRELHLSDDHYRNFGRKYYGNLIAGEVVQAEYTLAKKDGTPILCRLSGRAIDRESPPDLTKGFVWVIDDISAQKELEEEILQARKLESIGILAGGIGHDFNNILSAIMGNLGLAQRLIDPENKVKELLDAALEAATRAKDLTAKLLFFTRRDGHSVGSVKLPDLLGEVNFYRLLSEHTELKTEIQKGLFSMKIMPDHLKAILQNLLLNADGCLPQGGVVTLRAHNLELLDGDMPGLKRGKYVEVSVEDNGPGIEKKVLENIFDPYFTTKGRDSSKGIGLGLAIVHSIVKKNHGSIAVRSEKNEGTTFTIILPAAINDILAIKSG